MNKFVTLTGLLFLTSVLGYAPARAEVTSKPILYTDGGKSFRATLAYDDAKTDRQPAILMVHEWWGKTEETIERAKKIAGLGYVVLAVDMYGDGISSMKPEEAKELSKPFYASRALMRTRAAKGLQLLRDDPHVDPTRIAAMGYCFGGTVALELARSGADLKDVIVFHGGLSTPDEADNANIKGKVLVLNGQDDPFVPQAERDAFKASLAKSKIPLTFIDHPGAVHAFTNPKVDAVNLDGAKYNKQADEKSWEEMKSFLATNL